MSTDTQGASGRGAKPWRVPLWGAAATALVLPAIAMQVTEEMNWGFGDFAILGALLFAACLTFEIGARATVKPVYRLALGVTVLVALLLIWAELAVGIIGPG